MPRIYAPLGSSENKELIPVKENKKQEQKPAQSDKNEKKSSGEH
ncbi:MAG: hypothetical protein OSJ43_12620 [Oscillospiraceae bacterium]|nr:hypothetical protein [Oscillospiraceae bacterium]